LFGNEEDIVGRLKRVFQRSFKHSHYHTIRHIWFIWEGKDHHCIQSRPCYQNSEGWEGFRSVVMKSDLKCSKALNWKFCWLTMCQVAWCSGRAQKH